MSHTIPADLIKALPRGVAIEHCTITTLAALAADHVIDVAEADDTPAILLPGWCADDGNAEIHIPDADSGEDAARQYVEGGDWGDLDRTIWVDVWAWRRALVLDEDGRVAVIKIDRDRHTIEIDPEEPDMATTTETIRHGSFGPIVWDTATGETRAATQYDMDHLPVGPDLTAEEEASIPED